MIDFMKRVAVWNSKRYEQEFDKQLFIELIREEHKEWRDADSEVKKLDALCDTVYVAFGGSWRANLGLGELDQAMVHASNVLLNLIDCTELYPAYFISTYMDCFYILILIEIKRPKTSSSFPSEIAKTMMCSVELFIA